MLKYLVFCFVFVCFSGFSASKPNIIELNKQFVQIIGKIESNNNDFAIGDKGKAISRYQIWEICYLDAKNYDKSIKFEYSSLTNKEYAIKVITAYLNRYERKAIQNNDFESLARCWNGGPNWRKKTGKAKINLENYWKKFVDNSARF